MWVERSKRVPNNGNNYVNILKKILMVPDLDRLYKNNISIFIFPNLINPKMNDP